MLAFFGLTQEYRFHLFKMIHDICYHGNGGYNYDIIYDMPIWLRKLTYNFIVEQKQQESEAYKPKAKQGTQQIDMANPNKAKQIMKQSNEFAYKTKASKK
jgi:hypothetical protein